MKIPQKAPARAKKNQTEARKEKPAFMLEDGSLMETIHNPSLDPHTLFITIRADGAVETTSTGSLYGVTIHPPSRVPEHVETGILALPSGIADYGTPIELLRCLQDFIHRYVDLPAFEEALVAHYALSSWIWDAFDAIGFLRFQGEPGCGKSRTLEVLQQISYRGIRLGARCSESALFRMADELRGTLLLDEADMDSGMKGSWTKLLNDSYMKRGTVTLSVGTENDYEAKTFSTGGPKILASRRAFQDEALETRCLTVQLTSRALRGDIPRQLPSKDMQAQGADLRRMLLKYRFDKLRKITVDESPLHHLEPRQSQIGLPIYTISPDPDFKIAFLRFLEAQSTEQRANKPTTIVFRATKDMVHSNRETELVKVQHIASRATADSAQQELATEEDFGPRRVAEHLRALGFPVRRLRDGNYVVIRKSQLEEVGKRFTENPDGVIAGTHDEIVTIVTNVTNISSEGSHAK